MSPSSRASIPRGAVRSFGARVLDNSEVKKDTYVLRFSPLAETPAPRPGQFYMVGVGTGLEPLLKRPFCMFDHEEGRVHILYRVRGRGTELLRRVRPGETLAVLGPLGNAYPLPPRGKTPVVAAGGTAIASVFPLIKHLKGKAAVIYGARTVEEMVMMEELEGIARRLVLCTEDGTCGSAAMVPGMLDEFGLGPEHFLYVCGPRGMARAVLRLAAERSVKGVVSLEEFMACGIGACMGCAVRTPGGYRRVCKEGPVFKLDGVVL
ncbi:MAG: dihydroorotate dehydrogenase electron transfer subunit [Nitrospirota bacterium]